MSFTEMGSGIEEEKEEWLGVDTEEAFSMAFWCFVFQSVHSTRRPGVNREDGLETD